MKLFGYEITKANDPQGDLLAKQTSRGRSMRYFDIALSKAIGTKDIDTEYFINEGYKKCPPVYAIVNSIAEGVGKARWCIKDAEGNEVYIPLLNKPAGDAPALMHQANDIQSWADMNIEATTSELLEGNLFISGDFGEDGIAYSLFSLPTEGMHIYGDARKRKITSYTQQHSSGGAVKIPANEMMHIKYPNPDWEHGGSILFGVSAFEPASLSIQAYNDSLESGVFFLQNKGSQKILFNKSDEFELGIEGEDTIKQSLRSRNQGTSNNGNIGFIDGAHLDVIDISSDPQKALVLEQRWQAALEICNVLNYPPEKLGLNNATYQNGKQADKAYWEHCVIPILERRKAAYQRFIIPPFAKKAGMELYIDYSLEHIDALQEDRLMRGKSIKEYAGMISVNEAREMAGLAPIEGFADGGTGEDRYVGFTQAVVRDDEEISDINNDNENNNEDERTDS